MISAGSTPSAFEILPSVPGVVPPRVVILLIVGSATPEAVASSDLFMHARAIANSIFLVSTFMFSPRLMDSSVSIITDTFVSVKIHLNIFLQCVMLPQRGEKMDYGKKLKLARRWAGLTQAELAHKSDLAVITIRQYEAGNRKPSAENWFAIANALHISIDELNNAEILPTGPFDPETIMDEMELDEAKEIRQLKYQILKAFDLLNPAGQQKAVERVEELTEIPKYKKETPPAPEGTDGE